MYRHKLDGLFHAGDDTVAALALDDSKTVRTAAGEVCTRRHVFASGLRLYDTRVRTRRTLVLHPQVPHELPFIATNLALSGNVTAHFDDGGTATASWKRGSVFRPRGCESSFRIEGEQALHLVGVAADLPVLARWLGPRAPETLRPWLRDRLSASRSMEVPVPAARAAAAALLRPACGGALQAMMLEGIAMQVMASFVEALCGDTAERRGASGHERSAAREAHALLLDDMRAPPGLGELASAVGLSARRLDEAFREIFGGSVFATLRHERMQRALFALQGGDLPVKTIAWRVGYGHVANFSRAFRAHFGISPSAARGRRSGAGAARPSPKRPFS